MSRFPGNIIKLPNVTPTQSSASGVWSLKDQMVYQRNNLWPFQRDPYFNYTTLLLQGNVPNTTGPQAMNLPLAYNADASTNNFLVTPNGDVGPRPFSPYFGGNYSVLFGGSPYLSTPDTASLNFAGDFTVECLVYITGGSGARAIIHKADTNVGYALTLLSGGNVEVAVASLGFNSSTVLPTNQWVHLALVRSGSGTNNCKFYVNGNIDGQGTNTSSTGGTVTLGIGAVARSGAAGVNPFTGYISNVRISSSAVYTAPFSNAVPTSSLAVTANTVLLACAANRFIDQTGKTINVSGTPSITDNSPFVSTDFTTGAAYFDGLNDSLQVADATALDLGTGNFTLETWIYLTSGAGTFRQFFSKYAGGVGIEWYVSNANKLEVYFNGGAGQITSTGSINLNTWYHVALVREGTGAGQTKFYINGSQDGSNQVNLNVDNATALVIGESGAASNDFPGYVADMRVVKGVAVYTGNFTPPTRLLATSGAASAASYPSTTNVNTSFAESATSLLTLQTRAPSQNINFIDSSPNEFIVTKNGNTTQGTFSPFSPTGWGNYFNGSTDYLSLSDNAAWNMGSGDFTAECWIYPTSFANQGMILGQWSGDVGGTGLNWALMFDSGGSGYLRFLTSSNGSGVLFDLSTSTTSFTLTLNTWQHIAGVRNGNTFTIYVNGVSRATTTSASSLYDATNNFTIGAESSTTAQYFTGYISNIRLIKGQALATGNFTPPTALASSTVVGWTGTNVPTQSITGTVSLLTCQSNRFVDNGPNNFTITRNGSPSVQAFSPFAPANAVSPLVTGGSGYFDGGASSSSDYLNVTSSSLYRIEVNTTWTIECWVYALSLASTPVLITNTTNGASTGHSLYLNAGVPTLTQFGNAAFASTATINANAWNHIAVVCNSNSGTFYVNGSTAGTFTWGSGSAGGPLFVGAGYTGSNTLNGYISGVRYVVGSIVVPAGVPTTPPTAIPNTSLLLNFTNGAAVDATGKNNLESVGKAQNSTVQGKWGVGSMVFSRASADYLNSNAASTDLYAFGSGDFVIEFWVRLSAYPSGISIFYDSRPASTQGAYPALYVDSAGTLYYYVSSADRITSPSSTLGLSQWHYVAIARASGNTRLYVDGAQKGSTYSDSNVYLNGSQRPVIGTSGNNPAAGNCVDGFIDDLRITKGSARGYTGSTISIPTGPFPIG